MKQTDFIARLPSFTRFADVADPARYAPVPEDWRVYCCDVVNSTQAIERGRYKAVNMMGAACIMAAVNAAAKADDKAALAYVFGGDGATILAPDSLAPAIDGALTRTRRLAADGFGLAMRAGAVPVADIRARGADLRVAMMELGPGNRLAAFSGGGAALADALIKGDAEGVYALAEPDGAAPDLEGLSCRWEPLAARHGHMVCVLASATAADETARAWTYNHLISAIEAILRPDTDATRPVRADTMRFRWPPRGLEMERLASGRGRIALLAESFFQAVAERFDRKIGDYDAPVYRAEVRANCDDRRFDDTLRLVLDCTVDRLAAIEALLAAAYARGDIVYGIHVSDAALMTCLLFDLKDSRHLHFIDGADGGFTLAARAMKARTAEKASAGR